MFRIVQKKTWRKSSKRSQNERKLSSLELLPSEVRLRIYEHSVKKRIIALSPVHETEKWMVLPATAYVCWMIRDEILPVIASRTALVLDDNLNPTTGSCHINIYNWFVDRVTDVSIPVNAFDVSSDPSATGRFLQNQCNFPNLKVLRLSVQFSDLDVHLKSLSLDFTDSIPWKQQARKIRERTLEDLTMKRMAGLMEHYRSIDDFAVEFIEENNFVRVSISIMLLGFASLPLTASVGFCESADRRLCGHQG